MKNVFKIFLSFILIMMISCDSLLRDSEKPIDPSNTHWEMPTESSVVFNNMINAFQYREYESYIKCYSDSTTNNGKEFIFVPTATVDYPEKFENWGRSEELAYFKNMLSSCPIDSTLEFSILKEEEINNIGDSIQYQINYEIKVHHNLDNLNNKFVGSANIWLMKNPQNYWVIYFFEDISTSDEFPNWTDLKEYY